MHSSHEEPLGRKPQPAFHFPAPLLLFQFLQYFSSCHFAILEHSWRQFAEMSDTQGWGVVEYQPPLPWEIVGYNPSMSKAHSVIQADTVMGLANDSSNVTVPDFPPVSAKELNEGKVGNRVVRVPANRMTPLRENWMQLYTPIVENMKLEIRMNKKTRCVEIRTGEETEDAGALQKAADFLQAFVLGFAVEDAIALLRLDDLYLETFDVKDVKELKGDHLSRAVGRIAGKDGKTKFAIENATRTRIVVADTKIHILGSFQNMRLARNAISNLIMGSPPGKVYNKLKNVSKRLAERF